VGKQLILDPSTGTVATAAQGTHAVANPKGAVASWIEAELDGTGSTSAAGPLTYSWTVAPFSKQATITGANTATPFVILTSGPGTYSFNLTVTDSAGNQSTDTATLILQ
jgi:hypothetical protein